MGAASALERAGETAHALAYSGVAQGALQEECARLRAQLGDAMARLVLHDGASPPRCLSPAAAAPLRGLWGLFGAVLGATGEGGI